MAHKNRFTETIKHYVLAFLLLFTSSVVFATSYEFITIWQTTEENEVITLPISGSPTFSVDINWDDGSAIQTTTSANPSHSYAFAGNYNIRVSGTFDRINMRDSASNDANDAKLLEVTQWGTTRWHTMENAFFNAGNLVISTSAGNPDLSVITSMASMFESSGNSNFNSDISNWNVSAVTDMDSMFAATNFNSDISNWDVSRVRDMSFMFFGASVFNQGITGWNVSAVTDMGDMFSGARSFNQNISGWDVSNVDDMQNMFFNATAFEQNLSNWYIVLPATPIINSTEQILTISTQNAVLNTAFAGHTPAPTYTLSGTGGDNGGSSNSSSSSGGCTLTPKTSINNTTFDPMLSLLLGLALLALFRCKKPSLKH